MSKISARDIQVFVGGVLAYFGFQSLVWTPYEVIHSRDEFAAVSFIVGVVGLLLGIAIVAGNTRALFWTQIFLWLCIVQDVIGICVFVFGRFGISLKVPHMSLYQSIASFLTLSALLGLIAWSRSKRFRVEPDA